MEKREAYKVVTRKEQFLRYGYKFIYEYEYRKGEKTIKRIKRGDDRKWVLFVNGEPWFGNELFTTVLYWDEIGRKRTKCIKEFVGERC